MLIRWSRLLLAVNILISYQPVWASSTDAVGTDYGQCYSPQANIAGPQDSAYFIENQKRLAKGDQSQCNAAEGVYQIFAEGHVESLTFTNVPEILMRHMGANKYQSVLRIDNLDPKGNGKFSGLLIKTDTGWYMIKLKPNVGLPYTSLTPKNGVMKAFEDHYEKGQKIPEEMTFHRINFNHDNTSGTNGSLKMIYDSDATIQNYLNRTSDPVSFLKRFDEHAVRIPARMYELLNDPDFDQARATRHHTKMYDLIFQKAMDIAGQDVEKALFISMLTIDLRDRGACGAIEGFRGKTIVPISIFDNELTEASVVGKRSDAAQHFFASAMLTNKFGSTMATGYSKSTKLEWGKFFGRAFRTLHWGNDPDFDEFDFDGKMLFALSPTYRMQGEDLRYKPEYDKLADKHADRLGIEFAERLKNNAAILPSSVINDPNFSNFEAQIGLPKDKSQPWILEPDEAKIKVTDVRRTSGHTEFKIEIPAGLGNSTQSSNISRRMHGTKIYSYDGIKPTQECIGTAYFNDNTIIINKSFSSKCESYGPAKDQRYILDYRGRRFVIKDNGS